MRKGIILLIMMLVTINIAYAQYASCESELTPGENCTMMTPTITCSNYTYQIFNLSGSEVSNGSLTLLSDSIYYFNFTESGGDYIVKLCDDSTREIYVQGDDMGWQTALIIGTFGITLLFFFLSFAIAARHSPIRLLFFLLGLISTSATLHLITEMVAASVPTQTGIVSVLDSMYAASIYVFILVAIYYIVVYFIFDLVLKRIKEKKDKDDKFEF